MRLDFLQYVLSFTLSLQLPLVSSCLGGLRFSLLFLFVGTLLTHLDFSCLAGKIMFLLLSSYFL